MSLRESQRNFQSGRYNQITALDAAMTIVLRIGDHRCGASEFFRSA
jgi:hypothetical protein